MKKNKLRLWIFPLLFLLAGCIRITEGPIDSAEPFKITAEASIIREPKKVSNEKGELIPVEGEDSRLIIKTSVLNATQKDYKNVSYTLTLNEEVKPYLAAQILEMKPVESMDVITEEKQKELDARGQEETPVTFGFENEWGMLLTSEEDLEEYSSLEPEGIFEALKSIQVDVVWDGGMQRTILPLTLER